MKNKVTTLVIIGVVIIALIFAIYYENIKTYFTLMKLKGQQKNFVDGLNPQSQLLFASFINQIESQTGYEVYITSGYRSFAEQADLKAQNPSNASAGNSYHNYGLAIDINLVKDGVFKLRKSSSKQDWIDTGVPAIAEQYGLRWGGNFTNYHDPIHFDLGNNYSISYLKQLAEQVYGTDPYKVEGNKLFLITS